MNPSLARWGLIYPVHFLRNEPVPRYMKEIEACRCYSYEEWELHQRRCLGQLLDWCRRNDGYYASLLNGHSRCRDGEDVLAFLQEIPFLTKEIVSREYRNRKALRRGLDRRSTSGSTGSPLIFYKDRCATGYMDAVQNDCYSWHGIAVGDRQARFWGMPSGPSGRMALVKDFIKNRIRFSAFDLSEEAMLAYHTRLLAFRPSYIYGYPSLILEFVRFLARRELSLAGVPLKAAIGTGEFVFSDEKEELEALLQVPMFREYGCSEIGVIGFDCQYGNMHLAAANVIVEVVDPDGRRVAEGEEGEFVVTELHCGFFPFLRYRLGDRGSIGRETCPCGRNLPVLRVTAGRKDDYILTPEGGKVYDAILAYTLKKGIVQFKAVQESIDRLRVFVVPDGDYTPSLERDYVLRLQAALKSRIEIAFERVADIERERSGKLRYFRSELGRGVR